MVPTSQAAGPESVQGIGRPWMDPVEHAREKAASQPHHTFLVAALHSRLETVLELSRAGQPAKSAVGDMTQAPNLPTPTPG